MFVPGSEQWGIVAPDAFRIVAGRSSQNREREGGRKREKEGERERLFRRGRGGNM